MISLLNSATSIETPWFRSEVPNGKYQKDVAPPVDIIEHADHYVVEAEMPGMDPNTVDVQVMDYKLVITAERPAKKREEGHSRLRERSFGRFQRTLRLSESVDVDGIRAVLDKGVLTLHLPKRASAVERKIPVNAS
ncbi:MAG: Hsp20/alpha crystallin family protein [Polyangiaceae bacterium]|nr:Hsp20/alpha crystallin family protein [Polyangiaceae bacterium]